MANEVQSFGFKDNSFSQQVNVGKGEPSTTDASAWLEVGPDTDDSDRGMLPPRGDKSQVQNPRKGVIIFDVPTGKYWFFNGAEWELIGGEVDLSAYYTKAELQTPGDAQVHWDNITDKPGTLENVAETDPVWTAEKGNYYTKAEADAQFLESETDPVWNSEKGNYQTTAQADAKYLQNETDPNFMANGVPKTRQITINGETHDLSQDRTFTIEATGSGAIYLEASGIDTYTANATPALTEYETGKPLLVKFLAPNTGPATINIDGLGAKAITKDGTTPLVANDLKNDSIVQLVYDGTRFQLIGASSQTAGGGPANTAANLFNYFNFY